MLLLLAVVLLSASNLSALQEAAATPRKWSRCDSPGMVSLVYKCLHRYAAGFQHPIGRDTLKWTEEKYPDIPITYLIDVKDMADVTRLHLRLAKDHTIGLYAGHREKERVLDASTRSAFFEEATRKYKAAFRQPPEYIMFAFTIDKATEDFVRRRFGLRSIVLSFDFSDASTTALAISSQQAVDPAQRSFIVAPDTHRLKGQTLAGELARIFKTAGFDVVDIRQCLVPATTDDHDDLL